jgi:dienelactone hydrolase
MKETNVRIPADSVTLDGVLGIPENVQRIVVFAHGSGSSRLSPRNTSVARALRVAGIATLLFDLLTEDEAEDRDNVFDMDLLAQRLRRATAWIRTYQPTKNLRVGYFGASTGAAAALIAAAIETAIRAVVSRGGRPDLAGSALPKVKAPTLLIVGGNDTQVLRLNQQACERLTCEKQLVIVPGASHLFEEPGTLEEVTCLATDWFNRHLVDPAGKP